jgi:hypothetical protein
MRKSGWILLFLLFLVGCSSQPPAATPTAGPAPLAGTVDIQVPVSGAVIYSELLYLAGTADGIPAEGFKIQVFDLDQALLAEAIVQPANGAWTVEIPHQYQGEPIEATIVATGIDAEAGQDYDVEAIALSALANRPEGAFGTIISPMNGSDTGGDQIPVFGTGSGLFENTLIVQLRQADGTVIDEQIVTLTNPYFVDEVVWSTEMMTNGYTGSAELVAFYYSAQDGSEVVLQRVSITVSTAAG